MNKGYPIWTAPVAPGHKILNVREMHTVAGGVFFTNYSIVVPKNGYGPNDWDRFILDGEV